MSCTRVEYSTQMWSLAPSSQNERNASTHILHAWRAKAGREWAIMLATLRARRRDNEVPASRVQGMAARGLVNRVRGLGGAARTGFTQS